MKSKHEFAIVLGFVVFLLAAKIVYAAITYGDWSCAFANCVKVEVKK